MMPRSRSCPNPRSLAMYHRRSLVKGYRSGNTRDNETKMPMIVSRGSPSRGAIGHSQLSASRGAATRACANRTRVLLAVRPLGGDESASEDPLGGCVSAPYIGSSVGRTGTSLASPDTCACVPPPPGGHAGLREHLPGCPHGSAPTVSGENRQDPDIGRSANRTAADACVFQFTISARAADRGIGARSARCGDLRLGTPTSSSKKSGASLPRVSRTAWRGG